MTKQDEVRRKNLRRLLKDGAGNLSISAEDLRWLLDETSRLQQSNDRLRGQNRRMRIKAGGEAEPGEVASGEIDSGESKSGRGLPDEATD